MGEIMNIYYIFKINRAYTKLTKENPYNLYMILSGIYRSSVKDITCAYSLFNSINNLFNKKDITTITNTLKDNDSVQIYDNVITYNNYFTKESSRLIIHKSYLVIRSNKEESYLFEILKKIPNLFICNFKNKSYYWLDSDNNNYLYKKEKHDIIMTRE